MWRGVRRASGQERRGCRWNEVCVVALLHAQVLRQSSPTYPTMWQSAAYRAPELVPVCSPFPSVLFGGATVLLSSCCTLSDGRSVHSHGYLSNRRVILCLRIMLFVSVFVSLPPCECRMLCATPAHGQQGPQTSRGRKLGELFRYSCYFS